IEVPVLLGGPSGAALTVPVTVPYSTHDGSAVAGAGYTAPSGALTFPPRGTAHNITPPVLNPSGAAKGPSISVALRPPPHAHNPDGTGVVTIGASGGTHVTTPKISAPPATMDSKGDGYVDLPVTLSAPGVNPVTVNYSTANGTTNSNTSCSGSTYG